MVRINYNLREQDREWIEREAARRKLSRSALVRSLIEEAQVGQKTREEGKVNSWWTDSRVVRRKTPVDFLTNDQHLADAMKD